MSKKRGDLLPAPCVEVDELLESLICARVRESG
jgi:hypothetical protein